MVRGTWWGLGVLIPGYKGQKRVVATNCWVLMWQARPDNLCRLSRDLRGGVTDIPTDQSTDGQTDGAMDRRMNREKWDNASKNAYWIDCTFVFASLAAYLIYHFLFLSAWPVGRSVDTEFNRIDAGRRLLQYHVRNVAQTLIYVFAGMQYTV